MTGATVNTSPATGINNVKTESFNVGITTVTYTITDVNGLTNTCSFTVWIKNLNAPQFSVDCSTATDVAANAAAGICEAPVTVPGPTINNPCNEVYTITNDSPYKTSDTNASGTYPVGTTTFTWTITDASGNVFTCTQNVVVTDTQAPTLTCPANVEDLITNGGCDLVSSNIGDPVYNDNCGIESLTWEMTGATVNTSPATGINNVKTESFNVGVTTVTYTITDVNALTNTCSFTVWIKNLNAPQFSVNCSTATDVTANAADGICEAPVTVPGPTINNPCNEVYTITNDSPYKTSDTNASGTYPVGTTTFTWTITDASGNVFTCTQNVVVTDTQAPTLTCPANVEDLITNGGCDLVSSNIGDPVYNDNCGIESLTWEMTGATVNTSPATGINNVKTESFNVGVTTVTYTITDVNALTNTCSFTVWIKNLNAPQFSVNCSTATDVTANAADGICEAPVTVPGPTINNPCNEVYTITNDSPYKTSDTNASGSYPVGTTVVTWTITDASGNITYCTQNITVNDTQNPSINCPPDTEDQIINGGCDLVSSLVGKPTFDDNCGIQSLTWTLSGATTGNSAATGINYADGETYNVGITNVTYVVTDVNGNTNTCSHTVWIKNLTTPQLSVTCPSDISTTADEYICGANLTPQVPVINNPCNEAFWVTNDWPSAIDTLNVNGLYPIGTTKITWTVTDASGNITTCEQNITVTDLDPRLVCPSDIVVQAEFEVEYNSNVTVPPPTWSDNCPNPELSWTLTPPTGYETMYDISELTGTDPYPSPNTFYLGVTTITYKVTDAHGNEVSCDFTITVLGKPEITCPPLYETTTDPGVCIATRNSGDFGLPTLDEGVQPITWTWTITAPDGTTELASGSFVGSVSNPGPPPIPDVDFPIGTSTITWRAQNVSGFDECSHEVVVKDIEAPVVTCTDRDFIGCNTDIITDPAISLVTASSSYAEFTDPVNQGTASDNCEIAIVEYIDVVTGTCPTIVTRTWTVYDASGNNSSCTQIITIDDNVDPTASNPVPVTVECIADLPVPDVAVVTDEADNCTVNPVVAFISDVSDGNTCPEDNYQNLQHNR